MVDIAFARDESRPHVAAVPEVIGDHPPSCNVVAGDGRHLQTRDIAVEQDNWNSLLTQTAAIREDTVAEAIRIASTLYCSSDGRTSSTCFPAES